MKTFYDGMFIDSSKLHEEGIEYPIKLEYFKTMEEDNSWFGIEVVKTEYLEDTIRVESKNVENITKRADELDEILKLLRNNEVTPVAVDDVLKEIK